MVVSAAASRPNATSTQTYGPPSCGNAAPVSANIRAYGSRNATAMTAIQVTAWPPPEAICPITSKEITAATPIAMMSKRRRLRFRCGTGAGTDTAVVLLKAERSWAVRSGVRRITSCGIRSGSLGSGTRALGPPGPASPRRGRRRLPVLAAAR